MTLNTYRSPVTRALHAALDIAGRLRRAVGPGPHRRASALCVLDDATLRDLGIVPVEFESYAAEARRQAPTARMRASALDAA